MFLYRDSHFWSQKGRLFPAMCGRHGACPRLVRGRNTCECTGLSLSSRRAVGIFTYWVTGLNWNAGRASLFLWKSNSSWLLHMQHFILFSSPLLSSPPRTPPNPTLAFNSHGHCRSMLCDVTICFWNAFFVVVRYGLCLQKGLFLKREMLIYFVYYFFFISI